MRNHIKDRNKSKPETFMGLEEKLFAKHGSRHTEAAQNSKQRRCSVVTGDLLMFTDHKTTPLVMHAPSPLVSHLVPAGTQC